MSLGEQLKQFRQAKKLSQPDLAALAGIEQSYLSKLENDKAIPSNDILRKLTSALDIDLSMLLEKLSPESISAIKQLPDVEALVMKQQQHSFNQRRNWLLCSSAFIVLAVTLFFIGYSKLIFSELAYQYESPGIVKEGEHKGIFRDWPHLIPAGAERQSLRNTKGIEMMQRRDEQVIRVGSWLGNEIEKPVEGGMRYYAFDKEISVANPVNAWLQTIAVMIFMIGVMGFVLERKLFK